MIGRDSPTYEPNPTIEGRKLSEWTDDIGSSGWENLKRDEAVAVLRKHREQVIPIFVTWLGARDTFPQEVYFSVMSILEGKGGHLLDYRGAYFNQLDAARAIGQLEDGRPAVLDALKDVVRQYEGTGHYAGTVARETLQALEARRRDGTQPGKTGE